jgi:hypothetical protein
MGAGVVVVHGLFPMSGKPGQILAVLMSIAAGGGLYLAVGKLLRLAEIGEFFRAFRR